MRAPPQTTSHQKPFASTVSSQISDAQQDTPVSKPSSTVSKRKTSEAANAWSMLAQGQDEKCIELDSRVAGKHKPQIIARLLGTSKQSVKAKTKTNISKATSTKKWYSVN